MLANPFRTLVDRPAPVLLQSTDQHTVIIGNPTNQRSVKLGCIGHFIGEDFSNFQTALSPANHLLATRIRRGIRRAEPPNLAKNADLYKEGLDVTPQINVASDIVGDPRRMILS